MRAKALEYIKKLGRKVKNFDAEKWSKVCFDKMYDDIAAEGLQPVLNDYLYV